MPLDGDNGIDGNIFIIKKLIFIAYLNILLPDLCKNDKNARESMPDDLTLDFLIRKLF